MFLSASPFSSANSLSSSASVSLSYSLPGSRPPSVAAFLSSQLGGQSKQCTLDSPSYRSSRCLFLVVCETEKLAPKFAPRTELRSSLWERLEKGQLFCGTSSSRVRKGHKPSCRKAEYQRFSCR